MAKIAIDFDGTCVTHAFPDVGKDIGAVPVLKRLVAEDHQLILFTMRSNGETGNHLDSAIAWFAEHDIRLWGINVNPEQASWTSSPKAYAQLYINDAALGCPLHDDHNLSDRPFVNWPYVEALLEERGILPKKDNAVSAAIRAMNEEVGESIREEQ